MNNKLLILLLFITVCNISPLFSMEIDVDRDSDKRGSLILYIKDNDPNAFNALNKCIITEPLIENTFQKVMKCFNPFSWFDSTPSIIKRRVNSNDILFSAARAWVHDLIVGMLDYTENAIYNIGVLHGPKMATKCVNLFLQSGWSFEETFAHLMNFQNLNILLVDKFIGGNYSNNKMDGLSRLALAIASSYTKSLVDANRDKFSLQTVKEQTWSLLDNSVIIYLKDKNEEKSEKTFNVVNPIVAPVFLNKGRKDSERLMLDLLKPIANKLKINSNILIKEKMKQKNNVINNIVYDLIHAGIDIWNIIFPPPKQGFEIKNYGLDPSANKRAIPLELQTITPYIPIPLKIKVGLVLDGGYYKIFCNTVNKKHLDFSKKKCLFLEAFPRAQLGKEQVRPNKESKDQDQIWFLEPTADRYYSISCKTRHEGKKYLYLKSNSKSNSIKLIDSLKKGSKKHQKWFLELAGDYFRIGCDIENEKKRYLEAFPQGDEVKGMPEKTGKYKQDQQWKFKKVKW